MEVTAAPLVPAPVPVKIAASNTTFNHTLLRYYYQNFFPFKQMTRWLSYGNDADSRAVGNVADFLYRREFTFNLEGEVYVRYLCFRDAEQFADAVIKRQPERIEIGPVYTHPPDRNKTIDKSVFKPVERELIFDIDLNDYDDIRTCCTGANICKRCWTFMSVAISMLDQVLREDFGFRHILFVYSGRRGVHCHVSDEQARQLTNEERNAVIEYVNAISSDSTNNIGGSVSSESKTNINKVMNSLTLPLHPAFARAFAILEDEFSRNVIDKNGQALLCEEKHWNKILDMLPHLPDDFKLDGPPDGPAWNLRDKIQEAWRKPNVNPSKRWNILKTTVSALLERTGGKPSEGFKKGETATLPSHTRRTLEKLIPAIVFTYIYPRLDVNVSKQRNHLLKAPFCIHPKTGRVCVPIDVNTLNDFDPVTVPTCSQLMSQGMKYTQSQNTQTGSTSVFNIDNPLFKQTALKPYIDYFETWLHDLEATNARSRREHAQGLAAKREASEWGVGS